MPRVFFIGMNCPHPSCRKGTLHFIENFRSDEEAHWWCEKCSTVFTHTDPDSYPKWAKPVGRFFLFNEGGEEECSTHVEPVIKSTAA